MFSISVQNIVYQILLMFLVFVSFGFVVCLAFVGSRASFKCILCTAIETVESAVFLLLWVCDVYVFQVWRY